ncbi:MAG: alkaline shock response membrane anchor protein AmaP [Christensenellaceae bacterium]|jgi:uncharacterized alkaline shock family protein YloU
MKMKVGTRILLTVFLIVIILLCLFLIGTMAGFFHSSYLEGAVSTMLHGAMGYQAIYITVFIVIIVLCLALMFFGTGKQTPKTANIAIFESGSIVITVRAIEELVEKYVRETRDVKGLKSNVLSYTDYININLEVSVLPDIDIPALTKNLQDGLRENIQTLTGITVKNIKIMVMEIDDAHKINRVY